MISTRKNVRKKSTLKRSKAREQAVLSVISVRVSDEEKERIDEIMRLGNFKRYSDVLRMAIQVFRIPTCETQTIERYH